MITGCESEKSVERIPPLNKLVKFVDEYYGIRKGFIIPDKFQSFSNISHNEQGFKGEAMFIFTPKKEVMNRIDAKNYFKKFYETLDYEMLASGYFFYVKESDLSGPLHEMDNIEYYEPKENSLVEIYKLNDIG